MTRGVLYGVLIALVLAGAVAVSRPLRQRARQLAAALKVVSADTGDVMSSAVYQRFARRREAVASMRAALLQVAAIESMLDTTTLESTTWRYHAGEPVFLHPAKR